MRALRRLLLLIFLSGLSFLVINPMVNYLFLATDSVKFIKTGTPVNYYAFKTEYLFSVVTNKTFQDRIVYLISVFVGMLLFMKLSKRFALMNRKTPDVDGSSRWATKKEIEKMLYKIDEEKISEAKKSGIILFKDKNIFYVDDAKHHTIKCLELSCKE